MWRILLATWLILAWMATPALAQEVPTIPDPVPVTVDRSVTALLVLDMNDPVCSTRPPCVATVPAVASLLQRARAEGLTVMHSTTLTATGWIPEVNPLPGEPTVASNADKFFNTDLHELLQDRGITTLIIVGTAANGAPMYTSFEANARGYTIAVAEDGISAPEPFQTSLARYQLLNQPGFGNPTNEPLRTRAVTLTRTDMITFE